MPRSVGRSSDPDDVEESLKWLQNTLQRSVRPWLEGVESQDTIDEAAKHLRKELKAWAEDAEDVLDEWEFEKLRAKVEEPPAPTAGRRYARNPVTDLLMDRSFRCRVNKLKETHNDIVECNRDLRLGTGQGPRRRSSNLEPPPSSSLLGEWYIGDREDDVESLVAFLAEEATGEKLAVVPIVGAVGVGKTTFTQRIYNDPRLSKRFRLWGWVSASGYLGIMELMRAIGESLTGGACSHNQLEALQNFLRQKWMVRVFCWS